MPIHAAECGEKVREGVKQNEFNIKLYAKMKRILLSIMTLLFCHAGIAAQGQEQQYGQLYVADHLTLDSIKLGTVGKNLSSDENAIMVANGDTLRLTGMDGDAPIVEYRGKQYKTYASYLRFVADNEAGDGNVAQDEYDARYHSDMGHFFYTPVPLTIALLLLAVAGIMMLWVKRAETMSGAVKPLAVLIAAILGASILEIMMLMYTDDITWWCESASFWVSMLFLLPAMLALAIQLYVGFGIRNKLEELTGRKLSLKAAFLSVPIALVLMFIVAVMHYGDFVQGTVFLVTIVVCALYSWFRNGRGLGVVSGLAYTLFNFIYAVGALVAIAILIAIIWNMFLIVLPYLLIGAAAVAAFFLMANGPVAPSAAPARNNGDTWTNIDGQWGTKHSDGSFTTDGVTYKQDGITGEWKKK